jgi:hypothetical protein
MWHGLVKIRRSLWGVVGTAIPLKPLSDNTFQHLRFFAGIVGFRFDSRWRYQQTLDLTGVCFDSTGALPRALDHLDR